MEKTATYETDLNLRLGLPGREEPSTTSAKSGNKRSSSEMDSSSVTCDHDDHVPRRKAQVVGWPPVRSYFKNALQPKGAENQPDGCGMFVKVSMDGAAYLRKVDLKGYKSYPQLLKALENMFKCSFDAYSEREGYDGSDYVPTYEDKDGDWMLVGDVPWDMFITSCRRLRVMRGSEAKGLGRL